MRKKHQLILSTFIFVFLTIVQIAGQKWNIVTEKEINDKRSSLTREIIPNKYMIYTISINSIRDKLERSPDRFKATEDNNNILDIPLADGSIGKFRMTRSDVFHPDLAARYPMIQSYTGTNIDDPSSILKLSTSHNGINGMILSDVHQTVFIDKYAKETEDTYIVYYKNDYSKHLHNGEGQCTVEMPDDKLITTDEHARYGDCQLRKYRLALACTGEYAAFHGGNIPDVLAAFNTSMTRVNGIYEREFAITMEIIENTDQLIYLDGTNDPYTNNNDAGTAGSIMLGENQSNIDAIIGFDNYDIGHVYSTGGGGIASLRSPCTTRKARGVTGLGNPIGDPFWVDYVAHEMGHQFGGNHTQNNSCNRNNATAMEPGSASTIMGYAGICSPNVQNNSDDYFHAISISEVANFVVAGNGGCAETITIDNNAPILEPLFGNGLVLPISTPFGLTAVATDSDNEGITYCWEQMDNEAADMPPETTNTAGPAFRSYNPSSSPTRYFPRMQSLLLGNNQNTWEVLPSVNRNMNFNITIRDNNPLAGCTANDDLTVSFTDQAGPFNITSQNVTTTWNAGTEETITWNVANTDQVPVSCGQVDVYLSLDGGQNFDILLLEGTANDGEETIDVPFQFSNNCRLMVKCASSIFLDVNDSDFSIVAPFSATVQPSTVFTCPDQVATYQIDYTEFDENIVVTFDISGLPPGAFADFSDNPVTQDGTFELTVHDLQNVIPGEYIMTISASSPDLTLDQDITMIVSPAVAPLITTIYPENAETNVGIFPILSWEGEPSIVQYEIEVSENPSFENIVASQITNGPNTSGLSLTTQTVYYWRVRALSTCFESNWNTVQSFQTAGLTCFAETIAPNLPIPEEESIISSSLTISNEDIITMTEISLIIDHTYVGDLIARLTSPSGTIVTLFDRPGVPNSSFGCGNDNLNIQFSDFASNTAEDLEETCTPGEFAISGQFQPINLLSSLNGEPMNGDWTLSVEDRSDDDGGALVEWSISTCSSEILESAIVIINNDLILQNENQKQLSSEQLLTENLDPESVYYVLKSVPVNGNLQMLNTSTNMLEDMVIGSVFTQFDIEQGDIYYEVNNFDQSNDLFTFDVVDDQSRYAANQTFNILFSFDGLAVSANITKELVCFGDTDAEIIANASGGFAPYSFTLNEETNDTGIFTDLPAGDYTLDVSDSANNTTSQIITISEPNTLEVFTMVNQDSIFVEGTGGIEPYTYSLDNSNYTNATFLIGEVGASYTVYIRDSNGCISSIDDIEILTSLSNPILDGLKLYPNPASNSIQFGSQSDVKIIYSILDVTGRLIKMGESTNNQSIVIDNIAQGLYICKVKSGGGEKSFRLVVID